MALYSFHAERVSRSKGHSSVQYAAYRSGTKLKDERTGEIHDYTRKKDVIYSELLLPENCPDWAKDREQLWNEVEKVEKRADAYLCKQFIAPLQRELSKEENIALAREYFQDMFVKEKGVIVDLGIHDSGDGNPHAHAMVTLRTIDGDKFSKTKLRDMDNEFKKGKVTNVDVLIEWRAKWAEYTNKYLEKAKVKERVDHRSYKDRGIDKIPTKHLGVKAHHLEKKGIKTEIGELNRAIEKFNKEKIVELEKYKELKKQLEEAKAKLHVKYKFKNSDDALYFNIKNTYRKQCPEAKYLTTNGAMAIHNLNKHLGKTATVKAIYEMYTLLLKSVELDRKLIADLQKTIDVKNIKTEIEKNKDKKAELQKGLLGKVKNKAEIEQLTQVIEKLEYRLNNTGINPDSVDKKIQDLKEAKVKNNKSVETYNKVSEAKKGIEEARRRAERKAYFKNKYKKQQREDDRGRENGYSR